MAQQVEVNFDAETLVLLKKVLGRSRAKHSYRVENVGDEKSGSPRRSSKRRAMASGTLDACALLVSEESIHGYCLLANAKSRRC